MRLALLFDMPLAQEEQDQCRDAATSLRAYLRVVSDGAKWWSI